MMMMAMKMIMIIIMVMIIMMIIMVMIMIIIMVMIIMIIAVIVCDTHIPMKKDFCLSNKTIQFRRCQYTLPIMVPDCTSHNAPTSSQSFIKYLTASARFSMSAGERAIPFSFLHNFPEVWAKPNLHPYQRTLPSDSISLCISCLLANDAYSLSLTSRLMTLNMTSGQETAIFPNFSFFRRQKRS